MSKFMSVIVVFVLLLNLGVAAAIADKGVMMEGKHMGSDKAKLAIDGYCPVCITNGKFMKGSSNFSTEYKGMIYYFLAFEQQKMFVNDPEAYLSDLDSKFMVLKKANKGQMKKMEGSYK